jgi:predicted enzyme related to lactoylglutathione lyase
MIHGLRFVWLEVQDLDRSIWFYRDGLGFRVEEAAPWRGQRMASAEVEGLELVLVESGTAAQPRGAGLRLYLVTHDVEQYAAALRARGVAARDPGEEPWGGRVSHLQDPDGYLLCLVQSRHHMMPDEP